MIVGLIFLMSEILGAIELQKIKNKKIRVTFI